MTDDLVSPFELQKMYDAQKTMELHGWVSDLGSLI